MCKIKYLKYEKQVYLIRKRFKIFKVDVVFIKKEIYFIIKYIMFSKIIIIKIVGQKVILKSFKTIQIVLEN